MGLEIVWTRQSLKGYAHILKYLDDNWTEKEVLKFEKEIIDFLDLLSDHPYMLKESPSKGLRRGPVNKLTIITYRVTKSQLQVINLRSSRKISNK